MLVDAHILLWIAEDDPRLGERARELIGHDPFDRVLLAQAKVERLDFLTADRRPLALDYDWILDATK